MTQHLKEMTKINISWGGGVKGGRCVGLTDLPPSCDDCLEIWEPQTSGTLRVCPDLKRDRFTYKLRRRGSYYVYSSAVDL
jgi:hypothetical protein